MKAITLWQPWATLIAIGAKRIETRSWATSYRGPIAIHAAARRPERFSAAGYTVRAHLTKPEYYLSRHPGWEPVGLPRGVVMAIATLTDCVPTEKLDIDRRERAFGDYTPGRYGWVLSDVHALDQPIPAIGHQRLWNWDRPCPQHRCAGTLIPTERGHLNGTLVTYWDCTSGHDLREEHTSHDEPTPQPRLTPPDTVTKGGAQQHRM